ncbi:MAG: CoA-binding protein [Candidatus Proteinoplasmatales archaeon SG8-5]|nr:MAG: CoA-binding protein [Candidatus Proteinoplasmatales archaeon SG8-5]
MMEVLFNPRSVAVIGASTKELSIGNRVIKNLVDFGYKGRIYPINPKADEVRGIRAFGSILDVQDEVDLVHIVIPNKFVPMAIEDCGKKGVKVVIINSAGFKEIGGEGAELESQAVEKAKEHGIRLFGPNCQGIINTDADVRAYCNFTFTKPETGNISIVAQSGGVGEVINQRFSELGVGVRMYASNGNACDISIPEIIKYWGDDELTRVIVVHIESLPDPGEFMEVAREVAAKKPILAMKTGRTIEGAKAVSSHTGGLAKVDIATELMFRKCGIVTFRDEEELCQAAVAFATQPIPKGNRVGLITNTGGPAIIATDELVEAGLEIPPLSDNAVETLTGKLHAAAAVSNPIDVLATGDAGHFRAAMDTLMDDPQIDSVFLNFVTPFFVDTDSIAKEMAEVNKEGKKPIICNLMTDKAQWTETIRILKASGIPFYSFPETAARALAAMTRYNNLVSREVGTPTIFDDVDAEKAKAQIQTARNEGRELLSADEVFSLLDAYKISTAKWMTASNPEEAVAAAREIGFPVVLKVDAESIVHKSDVKGISLDVGEEEVKTVVEEMEERFAAEKPRFLVQEFLPEGKEIIIGAKAEPGIGHLIVFGLGGVYVEVLEDVAFGITPVTAYEATDLITSVKSHKLLSGFRGEEGVDEKALAEILQRVSQLVTDFPDISEMDLNPVIAYGDRALVADARIRISEE